MARGRLCAALALPLLGVHARAAGPPQTAAVPVRHVVIVGISGLTWNLVTPAAMPELWRLAAGGSVGSLVDYAQQPPACPSDGWLTLNSAARVPAMPGIIGANQAGRAGGTWAQRSRG